MLHPSFAYETTLERYFYCQSRANLGRLLSGQKNLYIILVLYQRGVPQILVCGLACKFRIHGFKAPPGFSDINACLPEIGFNPQIFCLFKQSTKIAAR